MIPNTEKKIFVCKQYVIIKKYIATIFFILLACNTNNKTNSEKNISETNTSKNSYCSYKDESGFLTIPIDVNQNEPLSLSDIADTVEQVKLEISDLPKSRKKIIFSESYIVLLVVELEKNNSQIIVFDNNGKFMNQIGSTGQGKGRYGHIFDIATDFKNKKIYVSTPSKIICYDIEGNFINESPLKEMVYLSFLKNKLFSFADRLEAGDVSKHKIRNMIYEINDKLSISDSIEIRKIDLNDNFYLSLDDRNYLTCMGGDETYLFHPVNIPDNLLHKPIITDTLYLFENKTLIPHLRINFGDKDKKRMIEYIYRNMRYVFVKHMKRMNEDRCFFYYDMKEKKGYNMRNGFMDNIQTGEIVDIRPLDFDTNKFYYLSNNIVNGTNNNGHNLTLYIGTLKNN